MKGQNWALVGILLSASNSWSFCGFFVAAGNAQLYRPSSQVLLVRQGKRTIMAIAPQYNGPPEDFAFIFPMPTNFRENDIKTLDPAIFDQINQLSAPRLVEYWEQDPCSDTTYRTQSNDFAGPKLNAASAMQPTTTASNSRFTLNEYKFALISASETSGLVTWLGHKISDQAVRTLAPHIRAKRKFLVARLDPNKVTRDSQGHLQLSPIHFGFDSDNVVFPVHLGLINEPTSTSQDLLIYVFAPGTRYEAGTYRNLLMPTNLEVAAQIRSHFSSFYADLFDAMVARFKNVVVTEHAWEAGSCEPCPTPPANPTLLQQLGADVPNSEPDSMGGDETNLPGWVLTRLHVRYDKSNYYDELRLRPSAPIVGGRAYRNGRNEAATHTRTSVNHFQSRTIIRYRWPYPTTCAEPIFDEWNGQSTTDGKPLAFASDSASTPRVKFDLKKVIYSKVKSLGLPGKSAQILRHDAVKERPIQLPVGPD